MKGYDVIEASARLRVHPLTPELRAKFFALIPHFAPTFTGPITASLRSEILRKHAELAPEPLIAYDPSQT